LDKEDKSRRVDEPQGARSASRREFLTGAVALGGASVALGSEGSAAAADPPAAVNPRLYSYVGGKTGRWSVISAKVIVGEPLPMVERIDYVHGAVDALPAGAKWVLRGVNTNERYATRAEKTRISIQVPLGRPEANYGAFIPIRKSPKWWALTQDERRALFEERSKHISIGFKYLPAVARRLNHCRDLSDNEPFDFLTIFDYDKQHATAFDDMMAELRATEEWKYVDREFDMRLVRIDT
jgi:hypothetical protein